jgi:hypothetical protein
VIDDGNFSFNLLRKYLKLHLKLQDYKPHTFAIFNYVFTAVNLLCASLDVSTGPMAMVLLCVKQVPLNSPALWAV